MEDIKNYFDNKVSKCSSAGDSHNNQKCTQKIYCNWEQERLAESTNQTYGGYREVQACKNFQKFAYKWYDAVALQLMNN